MPVALLKEVEHTTDEKATPQKLGFGKNVRWYQITSAKT
jgi:hypothetical protein